MTSTEGSAGARATGTTLVLLTLAAGQFFFAQRIPAVQPGRKDESSGVSPSA